MDDSLATDFFNSLLIVLVIYKTEIKESPAYRSLAEALRAGGKSASLFVYDNSPAEQKFEAEKCWNAFYQPDPHNSGVSVAYNIGFTKAKALKKKWLLLSDQDTVFPLNIFEKYQESILAFPAHELFSPMVRDSFVVSPFRFALGRGYSIANIRPGFHMLNDYKFINSGLLVSVNLYERSNGYDERFPLDFSDLAFIERLRKIVNEFVVIDAVCDHSLSSIENSKEMTIARFYYFVKASKTYGRFYGSTFFLSITRFLRAVKLSYQFRSMIFLKLLNQN